MLNSDDFVNSERIIKKDPIIGSKNKECVESIINSDDLVNNKEIIKKDPIIGSKNKECVKNIINSYDLWTSYIDKEIIEKKISIIEPTTKR